jgi:hypothetical protein
MLKKSFLMLTGSVIFIIGMILFPLPVPFGLPTMLVGLAIMLKASNKVKKVLIIWSAKHPLSRQLWQAFKTYRRRKKSPV